MTCGFCFPVCPHCRTSCASEVKLCKSAQAVTDGALLCASSKGALNASVGRAQGKRGFEVPGGSLSVPVGSNFVPVSELCSQRAQVT